MNLLPIARKISASTLSSGNKEKLDEIMRRTIAENRDSKIDAVLEGKEYIEKKVEDDPEYESASGILPVKPLSAPSCTLLYMYYIYKEK